MVDDEDFEWLNKYRWFAARKPNETTYYVKGYTKQVNWVRKHVSMHRLILGLDNPKILSDHIDHNGLNNQRNNLRAATPSQNNTNTSGRGTSKFLGVYNMIIKQKRKNGRIVIYNYWSAGIHNGEKVLRLGTYPFTKEGEIRAAKAYDEAAKKYHGEFANFNFKD